jgi:hypothetical protein
VIAADPEGHGRRRIVDEHVANVGFFDVQIDRKAKTRRQLSLYYFGYQALRALAIVC